jgi:hypothetical protein
MRKGIFLFLMGFFIFQFVNIEMYTSLSYKAGYNIEMYTGLFNKAECYAEEEKVNPDEWDFGQVKEGEILKHDFILKNQTKDPLEIMSVHSSCGCTASETDKKFLLPQESTVIKVVFNSKGYAGPVTQYVYVNTGNVDLAIIKFTIKGQVVKEDN